ncbi:MAG: tRNA pseudouridine synthase A, partial [Ferruginibacter sp.]
MPRYFIELAYKGTQFSGFQKQHNANTVQSELENALLVFYRNAIELTGSSRTDAGVHAFQNYFHFDVFEGLLMNDLQKDIYHLNAILPPDIVVKAIQLVREEAHCRFDAVSRTYQYQLYQQKNPFMHDRGFFYPHTINIDLLNKFAGMLKQHTNFETFAKRNAQLHTYHCSIYHSKWVQTEVGYMYEVTANRFLRGMVKGLVGTMLRAASKNIDVSAFSGIIESRNASAADFSIPSKGLALVKVSYPDT